MNKHYYLLLLAYFISSVGTWIFRLALPLYIYQMTHSSFDMSAAYAMTFLPYILILPFGGVIADRFSHNRVLIFGDAAASFISLLIFISALYYPDLQLTLALIFFLSSATAIHHPAFQGILPGLVSESHLSKANAYVQTSDNIINLLGPLFGAGIIAAMGTTMAIFADTLSYVIATVILTFVRPTHKITKDSTQKKNSIWSDMKNGLTYAMKNPVIKYGTLLFIFVNFASHLVAGNLMYFLAESLAMNAKTIGLVYSLSAIGAIGGSMLAPSLGRRFSSGPLMLSCIFGAAIGTSMLIAAKTVFGIVAARSIVSFCESTIVVTMFTLRHQVVPQRILGRTVALTRTISFTAIPLASLMGGMLLQFHHGFNTLIAISTSVLLLTALCGLFTPFAKSSREWVDYELETISN